jgi:hypothetical protein
MFSTLQPIIFVLTFRNVFGGSIKLPGNLPYVDFLLPGIFVQSVAFGAMNTGIGLSEDLHKGLIERFRSLRMARSAVLAGRALSDLVRNAGVALLMVGMGFLIGFRVHTGPVPFVASIGLLLLFSGFFVDLRPDRPRCAERRVCAGRVVPDPRPPRVRLDRVRAGREHADLAADLKRLAASVGRREGHAGAVDRRRDGCARAARAVVDGRPSRDLRSAAVGRYRRAA